jgi:hypothetical protein
MRTKPIDTRPATARRAFVSFLKKRSIAEWLSVGLLIAATGYLVVIFFVVRVCDDQLSNVGTVQKVCQHAGLTDILVAPVVLLMVAGLSTFFAEVSGFGITFKRRLEQVESEAFNARREAKEALLAAKYNTVRADFKPGEDRDAGMQIVWREMLKELRGERDFDVVEHLKNRHDSGLRLAGYAFLTANPDERFVDQLVEAMLADQEHFNQEMALFALKTNLEGKCDLLTNELRSELMRLRLEWQSRAAKGPVKKVSKRAQQVDQILLQCPDTSASAPPAAP